MNQQQTLSQVQIADLGIGEELSTGDLRLVFGGTPGVKSTPDNETMQINDGKVVHYD